MKKKNNQTQFKEWIEKQVKMYSPILGIQLQKIEVEFRETTKYLEISCTYPYIDPTIWFGPKALEDWAKGKVPSDRILHEMCHVITDPLYCKATNRFASKDEIEDERERLTDQIAAIVRGLTEK